MLIEDVVVVIVSHIEDICCSNVKFLRKSNRRLREIKCVACKITVLDKITLKVEILRVAKRQENTSVRNFCSNVKRLRLFGMEC